MAELLAASRATSHKVIIVAILVRKKPGDNPHLCHDANLDTVQLSPASPAREGIDPCSAVPPGVASAAQSPPDREPETAQENLEKHLGNEQRVARERRACCSSQNFGWPGELVRQDPVVSQIGG